MSQGWPAGTSHHAHDKLTDLLWDSSRRHARVTHELYPGEGGWDAQRLAISIGTAVELLLKHVLAQQSYHLLPDKSFSIETALTLDGKPPTTVSHLPQLTTVAGLAAFDRVNALCSLKLQKDDFKIIFEVRNAALHLGVASTKSNADAFKQMVLLIDRLFTHLGTEPSARVEYWGGDDAEAFVRAIVDQAISEVRVRYEQLVREAKTVYEKLLGGLADESKPAVIAQYAAVRPTIDSGVEEVSTHQCPACQNMGWVVYEVHRSTPTVEYPERGEYGYEPTFAYVDREGSANRFECGVCRLKLDRRDYLVEADVPLEVVLEPGEATEDEISEYEEAQVDSYIQQQIDEARGK